MLNVYLAGGITGLTFEEAFLWRQEVTNKLEPLGIKCYNPIKSNDLDKYNDGTDKFTSGNKICYLLDKFMVRQSDIILINFDTVKSYGTLVEKGWADGNKLIIIVSSKKLTHPFVTENSIIVKSLRDALEIIKELV